MSSVSSPPSMYPPSQFGTKADTCIQATCTTWDSRVDYSTQRIICERDFTYSASTRRGEGERTADISSWACLRSAPIDFFSTNLTTGRRILQVIKETICTPNLTRLSIAEFSTFPIALLNGVGFIQELEVSSVKFHPYPREIDGPQAHAPLSKLESLCLLDYGKAADIKLLPLLELIPRKLKRLRVGCGRMYEGPCLKLFQAIGGLPILQAFRIFTEPFPRKRLYHAGILAPLAEAFEFDFTEWQLAHPDEASTINLLQKVSEMLNHANPLPSLEQISIKNWIPEGKISLKYFHHPILARMEGRLLRPERFPQLARLHIICSYSTNDFWGTQVDEMEANLRTVVELAMPELHKRGCLLVDIMDTADTIYKAKGRGMAEMSSWSSAVDPDTTTMCGRLGLT
ncbi:hypothetical protein BKA70DRAFT_1216618 [Coprinopsis sp. MPI-PUGE-AT-0042]|nr:hypothetical protein BKA70DRAFT_1216618 [Coprinopsis sp. MPI-PUGE-AT-0042]